MTKSTSVSQAATSLLSLKIAPAQIIRGKKALAQSGEAIARLGNNPLIVGGDRSIKIIQPHLQPLLQSHNLKFTQANYGSDCSETSLANLRQALATQEVD